MTDYIQWLLEEEEESPLEEAAPTQIPIPRQGRRRLSGLFGIGPQQAEATQGGSLLPEEIRHHSAWKTDGSLPREETGRGKAEPDGRLGWSKPIRESLVDAARAAPGEEEPRGIKRARALEIYTALQKAGRAERLLAGAGASATVLTIPEAPDRRAEALGPLELDRCFEREARRYDNGFSLL